MAINTRDKRSSSVGVGQPWRNQLPNPSGSITAAARAHVALMYSGIAFSPPHAGGGKAITSTMSLGIEVRL